MSEANWYVVHTYSGYENKVKANIEKTIENRKLQDQILEVTVPMHKVIGGLEIVSAFGHAPKFAHCDAKWGIAKNCTLFWLRFVLGSCVQKYQLGYI